MSILETVLVGRLGGETLTAAVVVVVVVGCRNDLPIFALSQADDDDDVEVRLVTVSSEGGLCGGTAAPTVDCC